MKILTITSVFPNRLEPQLGIFVKERMFAVAKLCKLKVVAPVYWYKFLNKNFKIPYLELQKGIEIYHPKFFYTPRIFKSLDGLFFALSTIGTLLKIRKRFDFNIIDAHFAYPDGYGAVLIGKILNIPVSVTLRGTIERLGTHPIIRRQIRWALNNANTIIAVSNSLKDRATELGITSDKIIVIRNGIDPKKFYLLDKIDARKRLGLPLDKKILLSVGGLVKRKGFHHVIDILPEVIKKLPNLLYIIIGGPSIEGDISNLLKEKIEKLDLKDYVKLVGPKPHDELVYWYNAADIFCLLSSKEGCPNVVLESLACGTPVVCSAVGGIPEIIINEDLGFLVKNKNNLKETLIKAFYKEWNIHKISDYISKNTWDEISKKIIHTFQKII